MTVMNDSQSRQLPSLEEIEKIANIHRRGLASYEKRIDEARRNWRHAEAALIAERRKLDEAYAEEVRRIEKHLATLREEAQTEIVTAQRLAASSRLALEGLGS
jgi:hypothetical protein